MKHPKKSTLRNRADRLLQDYIKLKYKDELCWLCGERLVTVGHHFVYKSQSNATRYYLPNIIPLCQNCHCDIHCHPSMNNAKLTLKLGQAWFDDLEETRRQGQKFTLEWVETECKIFTELLQTLQGGE